MQFFVSLKKIYIQNCTEWVLWDSTHKKKKKTSIWCTGTHSTSLNFLSPVVLLFFIIINNIQYTFIKVDALKIIITLLTFSSADAIPQSLTIFHLLRFIILIHFFSKTLHAYFFILCMWLVIKVLSSHVSIFLEVSMHGSGNKAYSPG